MPEWHEMTADQQALEALNATITILLPETYQATFEALQPVSMRSAPLVYGADGGVAWDKIWGSFCDLAMAGGPPHKGRLLEPGRRADIDAAPAAYDDVTWEIRRGITMATDLKATVSPVPGWVSVDCYSDAMAAWLVRAIVMENVAATAVGRRLLLPAAPSFRLEKEIKNVITVIAKTCHYWLGHILPPQQYAIAQRLAAVAAEWPEVAPTWATEEAHGVVSPPVATLVDRLRGQAGVGPAGLMQAGSIGVTCADVPAAIWMMRALVAMNVLARREQSTLCVPVNPATDPQGDQVTRAVTHVHALAVVRGLPAPPQM